MIRRRQPRAADDSQDTPRGFDAFELRLGDVMRGERATLGKSLLDVQRELKIRATYIAAIENADPTAFETPGFIAGYVRSYARYLGLDPEWAYRRFCEEGDFATVNAMDAAASHKPQPARRKPVSEPLADPNAIFVPRGPAMFSQVQPGAIGSMLVLLSLIAVLGYGGWSVLKEIQQVRLAPLDDQPGLMADVDPLQVAGNAPVSDNAPSAPPSVEALDRLYRPQALDRPVMVARDGPIATIDPGEIGVLVSDRAQRAAERSFDAAVTTALAEAGAGGQRGLMRGRSGADSGSVQVVAADATPELAILAVRPAWVRISAADGTVLLEKILDAGESYVLPRTEEPPRLRAGNSGSVYFSVNGHTYGPSAPGAKVAKNIELSPRALTERYQLADIQADPDLAVALAQNDVSAGAAGPSR
ncbi:helix-turn-helix domain-containing protein [Rhodovulum sp. MB263]|uniref:helix-turn-helix domain-containing protein n=1 Tax=Rhodovulum sp. (strain MB263) TaxID=308754 RepID=UPI0009B7CFDB|nr:helix-turn-helix domain-containing protein [Rhodovulum sp. MB263]ARC88091.1 helix-turn-helix domain-containing protein [Rhodovulum sp. MB263]